MTRAVFDCVILLQAAARRTGPAGECLQAVRDGRFKLFLSPDILVEVRDVLSRTRTLRKFPALASPCRDMPYEGEGTAMHSVSFRAKIANHRGDSISQLACLRSQNISRGKFDTHAVPLHLSVDHATISPISQPNNHNSVGAQFASPPCR